MQEDARRRRLANGRLAGLEFADAKGRSGSTAASPTPN